MGYLLVFRRYAPFGSFGFGFEGDHRAGPSISLLSTARTTGLVPFERRSVGSIKANSSGTQYVGGGDRLRRLAGHHYSKVSCAISNKSVFRDSISFIANTAGANPMIPAAPDIDTFVEMSATWVGAGVRFQGKVRGDDFPNVEVFVLDSNGLGCLLFDGRTTGRKNTGPIGRLAGSHESQILGAFFCSISASPNDEFVHSKSSCPITKMDSGRRSEPQFGGGSSGGGGASGSYR